MNRKELKPKSTPIVSKEAIRLNEVIVAAIHDVKGVDVVQLDLSQVIDASADFFIICSGNSTTHVMGIVDKILKEVEEKLDLKPNHTEGKQGRSWMLVDYFSTIVHVFTPDKRVYYNLESLWSDAPVLRLPNV